jgi:hypothetical protein
MDKLIVISTGSFIALPVGLAEGQASSEEE